MKQFLHFLALFSYLNILCFEVKYGNLIDLTPIESNETFVEVVLGKVFQVGQSEIPQHLPEIIYDEYRVSGFSIGLVAAVLLIAWFCAHVLLVTGSITHPVYSSRTQFLPGYYSFLTRYQLF